MRIGRDIIKRVSLSEYLSGNCQYRACKHNDCGVCMNEDDEFLNHIESLSIDVHKNKHEKIVCQAEFNEGECIYCGAEMVKVSNRVPYGGTTVVEMLYICPKC